MGVKLPVEMPHGARDWCLIFLIFVMATLPVVAFVCIIYSKVLPVLGLR